MNEVKEWLYNAFGFSAFDMVALVLLFDHDFLGAFGLPSWVANVASVWLYVNVVIPSVLYIVVSIGQWLFTRKKN